MEFPVSFVKTLSEEVDKLNASILRVRELHVPVNDGGCGDPECCSPGDSEDFCAVCQGYEYPCATIKVLDGEKLSENQEPI